MKHVTFTQMLRAAALVVMALGLLPMRGLTAPQAPPAQEKLPSIIASKPLNSAPGDDELRKLLIARYNAAVAEMAARFKEFQAGHCSLESMADAARHIVNSGLELSDKPAEQLELREKFLELEKEIEKIAQARFEAGRIPPADLERARYERLDAEVQVLKAKRKAGTQQPR
jgi:hypothetical protein